MMKIQFREEFAMKYSKIGWFEGVGRLLNRPPQAFAALHAGEDYPGVRGSVRFYPTDRGVLIAARVVGLPMSQEECAGNFYGFHIHEGNACSGGDFMSAGGHYSPGRCAHPFHAGDLPPLLGASGEAFSVVLTDRVTLPELIGKTIVIHAAPDDFVSQPAGNAGDRIACGVIVQVGL